MTLHLINNFYDLIDRLESDWILPKWERERLYKRYLKTKYRLEKLKSSALPKGEVK